jgi:hypothetical protein
MAAETVPASTQSDGKWRITNVPTGSNAKSVAILNGVTAKPITYGLTADGWNHSKTQGTVEDKRLTLIQDLTRPGRITESLEIRCVASSVADSADAILSALSTSGAETQFIVRRAIDNATTHVVAQIADLLTGVIGVRRPDAPTENGVDTVSYTFYFTKPTENQVSLVA